MTQESKALAVKEAAKLQQYGGLMDDAPVAASDILIQKLLLMQGQSQFVQDEKARVGEIRTSVEGAKIMDKGGEIEIIPFSVFKTWVRVKKKGNEFFEQIPLTMSNCTMPREETVNGEEIINFETINYYCLLPTEIKTGVYMPYVVSFRSTSYLAGKALETARAKLQDFKKPICFRTFKLSGEQRTNDLGTFYVFKVAEARDTTDAELEAVKKWHSIVKSGRARVDESEHAEATVTEKNVTPGKADEGDQF